MIYKLIITLAAISLFTACSETNTEPQPKTGILEVYSVNELNTWDPAGIDTMKYYSLTNNKIIPSNEANTTNWDIAFYRTKIYANTGSAGPGNAGILALKNTEFSTLAEAPVAGYVEAILSSADGWYTYDPAAHTITATPGVVLVVHCSDGNYAKIQILSYYKGYPDNIPEKVEERIDKTYSFKYAIQKNGTTDLQ